MEFVQSVLNMVDFDAIKQLDIKIKGPGMLLAAFFVYRAFRSITSFSPVSLVMNLVYAVGLVVILSQWGPQVQLLLLPTIENYLNQPADGNATPPATGQPQSN